MSIELEPYLVDSHVIDWKHAAIFAKARELKALTRDELALVKVSFNYVRDEVSHIDDAAVPQITSRASEVLAAQTGYCYAKSHLLAALLRANGVAAGFSYQRLSLGNGQFCLHGLNSVYLTDFGWHKIDARGNSNKTIATYFKPPATSFAFTTDSDGEQDSTIIYAAPLAVVLDALASATSVQQMNQNLPDQMLTRSTI